jgi:transcription elongation factor GreA
METIVKNAKRILSKKGMKELKKSIASLEHDLKMARLDLREVDKTSGRDEIFERIEKLATIELIEENLSAKRQLLDNSVLLPSKRARLKVAIGSIVDLIDQQGRLVRYTIVDSIEADPSDGRISAASPLGKNLIGKTVQDIIEWSNGKNGNKLQLVRIM